MARPNPSPFLSFLHHLRAGGVGRVGIVLFAAIPLVSWLWAEAQLARGGEGPIPLWCVLFIVLLSVLSCRSA